MRSGKCPKCGSTEIYHCFPNNGGGIGWGDEYNYLRVKARWGGESTGQWETFLCAACGYFENYILDREILDEMIRDPKSRWVKFEE